MKVNRRIYVVIIICLVIALIFFVYLCYKQNQNIKIYQQQISIDIDKCISTIQNRGIIIEDNMMSRKDVLDKIINEKRMKTSTAKILGEIYYKMGYAYQDLHQIDVTIYLDNTVSNNLSASIGIHFSFYIAKQILQQDTYYVSTYDIDWENDKFIEIDSEQLEVFTLMREIEGKWSEILERNGYGKQSHKVFSSNGELFRNGRWRNVLSEFSEYSNKLKVENRIALKYLF
jgi:hypothetical protein